MKKASLLLLIFISLTAFTCENEALDPNIEVETTNPGDPNNPNNPVAGSFQVDIDGETYVADVTTAAFINGVVNVTALRNNNEETIAITLQANETGLYQLGIANSGSTFVNGAAYTMQAGDNAFVSGLPGNTVSQGEVNLLEIDQDNQTISGTFFFTAYREVTIGDVETLEFTNGSFTNIPYSGDLGDINNPDNSFFAKVDGVEFVEDAINGVETLGFANTIAVVGVKNNNQSISVTVPNTITPGDYTFGNLDLGSVIGVYNESDTDSFLAEGNVTITVHDTANNRIEGTFSFTGALLLEPTNTREITEGSFAVTYQ